MQAWLVPTKTNAVPWKRRARFEEGTPTWPDTVTQILTFILPNALPAYCHANVDLSLPRASTTQVGFDGTHWSIADQRRLAAGVEFRSGQRTEGLGLMMAKDAGPSLAPLPAHHPHPFD